jgi:putative RNA 2'-phosphotransferase
MESWRPPDIPCLTLRKASMGAQYNPKTLAKTLSYIVFHAPSEHGLFWDPDGTMPWKELFWVLQEDPSLRFVRETHIREIAYLGLQIPFALEGNLIRLQPPLEQPDYPPATHIPELLYFACRRKQLVFVREHGIVASHRPFVPIFGNRELALRLGQRRDPEAVLLQVFAANAALGGERIRLAGAELYLVEAIPARYLVFPLLRAKQQASLTARKKVEAKASRPDLPSAAGSFLVEDRHLRTHFAAVNGVDKPEKQKGKKKGDWKREARGERHKRIL